MFLQESEFGPSRIKAGCRMYICIVNFRQTVLGIRTTSYAYKPAGCSVQLHFSAFHDDDDVLDLARFDVLRTSKRFVKPA